MAARKDIIFAWEAGFRDVILEGDNINVMNVVRSKEVSLASGGAIIADVFQVGMSCDRVSYYFFKRELVIVWFTLWPNLLGLLLIL